MTQDNFRSAILLLTKRMQNGELVFPKYKSVFDELEQLTNVQRYVVGGIEVTEFEPEDSWSKNTFFSPIDGIV